MKPTEFQKWELEALRLIYQQLPPSAKADVKAFILGEKNEQK